MSRLVTYLTPDTLLKSGRALWQQLRFMVGDIVRSRRVLYALTAVACRQKYAGSILGTLWYPLYSLLLLGSYCFIYLVVFRMKYREFSTYDYVLFVFAGLVPYLGFSEAVTGSVLSVRANLAILRNSVFPIGLVPLKYVLAAFVPLVCSLAVLLLMIAPTEHAGWHWFYLPVPVVSLLLFALAVAWISSAIGVVIPDIAQLINVALLLFMFVSPIGYSIDMVPESARPLVYLNPMTYLIESFRYALIGIRESPFWHDAVFLLATMLFAAFAGAFFRRLTPLFSDYE